MKGRENVLCSLRAMDIPYALYEHPPVMTMADCREIHGIPWDMTEMCKNVFLCNRQETRFYLLLLRHNIPFRTAIVSKALGVARLSFANEALLPGMLGVMAGSVTPLGLIHDKENRVRLLADDGLKAYANLAFHPCDNTATVVLRGSDFWDVFIKKTSHEATFVKCEPA